MKMKKTSGQNLQIKVRDKQTGEEGWICVPNLFFPLFEAYIESISDAIEKRG